MNLRDKNILVVGGAGFIGSHLVDQLSDCRVRVLDDFSTGRRENIRQHQDNDRVSVVEGDLADCETRTKALQDIDVVFHLACRNVRHSIGQPRANHDVNATATLDLLEAARAANVQRFVYVSSSEVYGTAQHVPMKEDHPCRPETVYGAGKLAGEAYARAYHRTYDVPTVIVRPFNNFGPRSHFAGDSGEVIPRFAVWALNHQAPVVFGDGRQTRDFIYVEETAYWLTQVATCDELIGDTVNLGSGNETSVQQLAEIIYEQAGVDLPAIEYRTPRPGDVRRHCADAHHARQTLGFEIRIGVREGIGRLLSHLRDAYPDPQEMLRDVGSRNWRV